MSSENNNPIKNGRGDKNIIDDSQDIINLNEVNTDLVTPDELEDTYLYFINDKIKKNECIYSPRPPKKNNNNNDKIISSSSLRNYRQKDELGTVLNNPPKSLVLNKTMIISPLKSILEEPVETYNSRPDRHFSLPNIKFQSVWYDDKKNGTTKTELPDIKLPDIKFPDTKFPDIKFPDISKSLKSLKSSKSSTLQSIDESNIINNFTNEKSSLPKSKKSNSFKNLTQGDTTIITKEGHFIFKSNYRLKKYLITLKSSNYNVNNLLEKFICRRMSLTQDTEEWIWYNFKYQFSFHIKYNIDNYGNTCNYSVIIKYAKNKVFNIDNLLISEDILHLDKEMKNLFINILEGNYNHYWQLSSIQFSKNTKYITTALLAPLQYYRLYLLYLKNYISTDKYNKFIKTLYYYGNLDINDEYLQNNLRKTVYYD